MKKKEQQNDIISTRDFMRGFSRIANRPQYDAYTIVQHGKPVGTYMPLREAKKKKYLTLQDLEKARFRSGKKNLSRQIDRIVYGIGR